MEFRPKRSWGWVWLAGLALLMFYSAFLLGLRSGAPLFALAFAVPTALIGLFALYLAVLFPTMRYDLMAEELRLRYGRMCWRVPLAAVRDVRTEDLGWTIWSSWRFPGFALFNVPYAKLGNVRMCSTRSVRGVLLIETDDARYGISPADEEGFEVALAKARAGEPVGQGGFGRERASDG